MSKLCNKLDKQLSFDFDGKIKEYISLKEEVLNGKPPPTPIGSYEETCIEIAAVIKLAIRKSGLSREQIVDGINEYFGATSPGVVGGDKKGKTLSIHMLNHYLSKPSEYPIPTFYIYAIQRITKSLDPTRALAEAEDARVISGDEVRQMALGKLDETILEMQRLKKDLRLKK